MELSDNTHPKLLRRSQRIFCRLGKIFVVKARPWKEVGARELDSELLELVKKKQLKWANPQDSWDVLILTTILKDKAKIIFKKSKDNF